MPWSSNRSSIQASCSQSNSHARAARVLSAPPFTERKYMSSTSTQNQDLLTVGLAQITPIWLNREATLVKIIDYIERAATRNCDFVTFGEALLPGYPFWL